LKRIVKIKDELSSQYLRAGLSNNIHAVGIGRLAPAGDYCIQVFVVDATQELWPGAGPATTLAGSFFRGIPLLLIQMARMGFLIDTAVDFAAGQYVNGIRDQQAVIVGGISGANVNLTGQSGTIGYFCTRKSKLWRRKEVYLLSNSHVFVDLQNPKADDTELIVQPSPGERASNRPIGTLTNFSRLTFDGDTNEPNIIDAAICKLWDSQPHQPLIPLIGHSQRLCAASETWRSEKQCGSVDAPPVTRKAAFFQSISTFGSATTGRGNQPSLKISF
jgi:hypothetical protein